MGGYGDAKFKHGQLTNNAKAAEQFPQYFLPINSERAIEAAPKEVAPTPTPTLEEEMLTESKETEEKPQMLTEVPKPVELKPEEKEEAVDVKDTAPLLVETKKKRTRKSK